MPEFNLTDHRSPFRGVIATHDRSRSRLRQWRAQFSAHAEALSEFFLTYPQDSRWVGYWSSRRATLVECFQGKATYQGHPRVFDPWGGWWSGSWHGGGGSSPQYHIWDSTVGYQGAHVQPVTQSVQRYTHQGNITGAVQAHPPQADLGINVWRSGDGITGWVSKRQSGAVELPHVGYSPNPHTLFWIAQADFRGDYYLFFEWVDPPSRTYGIHGRTFQLQGGRFKRGALTGWTVYHKDTRPSRRH